LEESRSVQQEGHVIQIRRVWRSQLFTLVAFALSSPLAVWLSHLFPGSIIAGPLFDIGEKTLILKVPFFWCIPAFFGFKAIINVNDVRYLLDPTGIEAREGIFSLNQTFTRLRYEDIRSIDSRQTLLDRILGIGAVDLGTAASAGLEMSLTGISDPLAVQKMIQAERDARQASLSGQDGITNARNSGYNRVAGQ
jgi:membrane protein YdbS with pleckstrin-like domain